MEKMKIGFPALGKADQRESLSNIQKRGWLQELNVNCGTFAVSVG